jgi:ribosomal-protein-alanine N-acetyltransferase
MPAEGSERPEPDLRLAAELAGVHAAAFAGDGRPRSGPEILALLNEPTVAVRLAHRERPEPGGTLALAGFALYRAVAGEAEILTLSVLPEARRSGIGAGLLAACETGARAAGRRACSWRWPPETPPRGLSTTAPAIANAGAARVIQRPDASRDDAVVMEKKF